MAVTYTVAAVFVRRSLNELAACSGVRQFATAGRLLFIGAIFSILILPVVLMWISFMALAFAFSTMEKPKSAPPSPPSEISPLPASA
jgi:uncharacterized membrane protein